MDPRTLARLHGAARFAVGAAYVAAPGPAARAWIGADGDRESVRVLARAFGARDGAIGLGVLRAVGAGHGARPWVRAGVVADAADLLATVRARDSLPALQVAGVALIAGGSVAIGLWLDRAVD
jgi:hypothetical protein